jgi:hypothetical protein
MAAGPWVVYNEFKATMGLKALNLNVDAMQVALFLSTSNAGSAALVNAKYATLTNEVAAANGYATGGVAVAPATYSQTAGTATFDTADASWTAAGGSITARFAVLYDNTATNKDLIAYCLLDSTPADVTVTTGNTLTIQIANVFTLT